MEISITNLVPSPSAEGSGWAGTYSTDHAFVGSKSLKLTGTTSTPEVTVSTTAGIQLQPSHIYYARMYGYQDTKSAGSVGFYWPIAEPSFQEGLPLKAAGVWQMYSGRNIRSSFSAGSYQMRLDFNNSYVAGVIYLDGMMLIDLTATFGAGVEPSKEWCDAHIPYFEGTIRVYAGLLPYVQTASIVPNPVVINNKFAITIGTFEEWQIFEPIKYYSGELYSGEV